MNKKDKLRYINNKKMIKKKKEKIIMVNVVFGLRPQAFDHIKENKSVTFTHSTIFFFY